MKNYLQKATTRPKADSIRARDIVTIKKRCAQYRKKEEDRVKNLNASKKKGQPLFPKNENKLLPTIKRKRKLHKERQSERRKVGAKEEEEKVCFNSKK